MADEGKGGCKKRCKVTCKRRTEDYEDRILMMEASNCLLRFELGTSLTSSHDRFHKLKESTCIFFRGDRTDFMLHIKEKGSVSLQNHHIN